MVNWASLLTGSVVIELFDATTFGDPTLPRSTNRDGVQLCFIVDDVERERERLLAGGAQPHPVVTEPWGRYSSFHDPEGNYPQVYDVFDRRTARNRCIRQSPLAVSSSTHDAAPHQIRQSLTRQRS